MSDPISTTSATAAVTTASLLTLVPGVDPAVVIGAFTGAMLFILSDESIGKFKRFGLFMASFLGGALCAQWAAVALSFFLPSTLPVNPGMAAIIAAACVVRILQYIIHLSNNPDSWLSVIKGLRGKS
ncbi:putative holin [uncultured Rheinheimera sp.]|uniref:putative holin n=1 Tax=uncultured Rheinheimera sp. TaxID=400532 RepID=UPI0025985B61|nr:putative holin [uncultured Rheinheimera sp.]